MKASYSDRPAPSAGGAVASSARLPAISGRTHRPRGTTSARSYRTGWETKSLSTAEAVRKQLQTAEDDVMMLPFFFHWKNYSALKQIGRSYAPPRRFREEHAENSTRVEVKNKCGRKTWEDAWKLAAQYEPEPWPPHKPGENPYMPKLKTDGAGEQLSARRKPRDWSVIADFLERVITELGGEAYDKRHVFSPGKARRMSRMGQEVPQATGKGHRPSFKIDHAAAVGAKVGGDGEVCVAFELLLAPGSRDDDHGDDSSDDADEKADRQDASTKQQRIAKGNGKWETFGKGKSEPEAKARALCKLLKTVMAEDVPELSDMVQTLTKGKGKGELVLKALRNPLRDTRNDSLYYVMAHHHLASKRAQAAWQTCRERVWVSRDARAPGLFWTTDGEVGGKQPANTEVLVNEALSNLLQTKWSEKMERNRQDVMLALTGDARPQLMLTLTVDELREVKDWQELSFGTVIKVRAAPRESSITGNGQRVESAEGLGQRMESALGRLGALGQSAKRDVHTTNATTHASASKREVIWFQPIDTHFSKAFVRCWNSIPGPLDDGY